MHLTNDHVVDVVVGIGHVVDVRLILGDEMLNYFGWKVTIVAVDLGVDVVVVGHEAVGDIAIVVVGLSHVVRLILENEKKDYFLRKLFN